MGLVSRLLGGHKVDWLGLNGTFSTNRLYRAIKKDWSLLKMFISDRLGGHNSGDIKPVVSRHKNSTVKHVCSVDVLSHSGATVSMETSQMVLNSLQSVSSRQMNSDPPRQKNRRQLVHYSKAVPQYHRGSVFWDTGYTHVQPIINNQCSGLLWSAGNPP